MEYKLVRKKAIYPEQADTFTVIVAETCEALSHHESASEANAAIRRYEAADRRRKREADRIDGYDRDDLGESPDF